MTDPATVYFFKKYYRNIIKWWFVVYNPEAKKIWPSKEEAELARQKELEEKHLENEIAESDNMEDELQTVNDEAFNAATGSYSGLYGQKPVDEDTQSALDAILNASSSQHNIDSLFQEESSPKNDVYIPPDQDEVIREANAIYERLLREAAEDEAKRKAEVEAVRRSMEAQSEQAAQ